MRSSTARRPRRIARLVVHAQHPQAGAHPAGAVGVARGRRGGRFGAGDLDREHAAPAGAGVQDDVAIQELGDLAHDGQAQADAAVAGA